MKVVAKVGKVSFRNSLLRRLFERRLRAIDEFRRRPHEVQRRQLQALLRQGADTEFGVYHGLRSVRTPEAFAARVEVRDYGSFKGWIDRMMEGRRDVTAPGKVVRYARSSGTTSGRSKFIPVTGESLVRNHLRGMRDVAGLYAAAHPSTHVFSGKTLTLGGTCRRQHGVSTGDLSALLIEATPFWSGWFRTPRRRTALSADFEAKVERICRECVPQRVTSFAGVPSWNLALMRRVVEYTGCRNLREVWPDLELFVHGGTGFEPYRRVFADLMPDGVFMETYNASEGFFAIADDPQRDDLLLMLDYGAYYEFRDRATAVPLEGVRPGVDYALILTSCNGLWRYEIGDTVRFTSTDPYRIRITGRTHQFINVFGEELMVWNAERAVAAAAARSGAVAGEFTAAPRFSASGEPVGHQWVVEFIVPPVSGAVFAGALDEALMAENSDYEAKRRSSMARPRVDAVPPGTFGGWLLRTGKNKVPRLSNRREIVDTLLRRAATDGAEGTG